ncbi:hypothetical protein RUND412_008839 [Rhizina undulata]
MNRSPATTSDPQTHGGGVSGPSTLRNPVRRTPGAGSGQAGGMLLPPRDLLRALSRRGKALKTTEPYQPTSGTIVRPTPHRGKTAGSSRRSPDVAFYNDTLDDDDEDDRIQPPRLSLDLNYDPDDDEERILPPRLSLQLEDFDVTNQSIEFRRRAVFEQPVVGKASFGIRLSDRFADFNELGARAMGDWEREDEAGVGEMSFGSFGRVEGSVK